MQRAPSDGPLTSHCQLAVELRVHLFVPLVPPHFVHGLPHHRDGEHEALADRADL